MDLQDIFKHKNAIYAGMTLARITPRKLGYTIARKAGERIAREKPRVYQQLLKNIAHLPGTNSPPGNLDNLAKQAFINAGKFYYDFYHSVGKPFEIISKRVHIPEELFEKFREVQRSGRGVLLAGIHTGNFDLGLITLAGGGLDLLALSTANPNEGYAVQNKLRTGYGIEVTPIRPASLRRAIQKLRSSGIVATGLDWPNPEETTLTKVFGKLAYIPLGTARLALLSDAVTFILSFYTTGDGHLLLNFSDPIEVTRTGDKKEDIKHNTNTYIRVFEDFVQQHPDQWLMYHKFWADEPTLTKPDQGNHNG